MEGEKLEKFTDRIMSDVNAAMSGMNLYIGHRLDLFKALQLLGNTDAKELAVEAGFSKFEVLPVENDFWRFYQLKH